MPLTTSWSSGGHRVTVTTHRHTGESEADWQARHDRAVAEAKILWPED